MRNLSYVLAALVKRYGLEVEIGLDQRPRLWWTAYTQGSGVAFNASLGEDFGPMLREFVGAGKLAEAVKAKALLDADDVRVTIKHSDRHYYHEGTMDVEVDDRSGRDFDDAENEAIKALEEVVTSIKNRASIKAYALLEDYLLLEVSNDEVFRTFTTKHFQVELIKARSPEQSDGPLEHELECLTLDEGIEMLETVTAKYGQYEAFDLKVVVSGRETEDDDWDEISTAHLGGGIYEKTAGPSWRDVLREAITDARKESNFYKAHFKEAA